MRLTVGPLPPAVYWRRRAVVLGAVLLFMIVFVYSCFGPSGPDEAGRDPGGNSSPSTGSSPLTPETGGPGGGAPESTPPSGDPSSPPEGGEPPVEPAGGPPEGGGQEMPAPPPVDNECADEEMTVVPVPSHTSAVRGEPISLRLRIKNVSGRTCNRDVGADLQELYVKSGARKVWSSDACSTVQANEVKTFPPNHEEEYTVAWNGRQSSRCDNGLANGDYLAVGTYQLTGRLGDKLSDPVRITITS